MLPAKWQLFLLCVTRDSKHLPQGPADKHVKDLGQKSVQQITHYPWLTTLCSTGLATSDVEHMARLYLTTRETKQV